VNYSSRRTESSSEHFASDLSLLKANDYDVNISGARIRTRYLWIRKRVSYPLHHSASRMTRRQFIARNSPRCQTASQHHVVVSFQARGDTPKYDQRRQAPCKHVVTSTGCSQLYVCLTATLSAALTDGHRSGLTGCQAVVFIPLAYILRRAAAPV